MLRHRSSKRKLCSLVETVVRTTKRLKLDKGEAWRLQSLLAPGLLKPTPRRASKKAHRGEDGALAPAIGRANSTSSKKSRRQIVKVKRRSGVLTTLSLTGDAEEPHDRKYDKSSDMQAKMYVNLLFVQQHVKAVHGDAYLAELLVKLQHPDCTGKGEASSLTALRPRLQELLDGNQLVVSREAYLAQHPDWKTRSRSSQPKKKSSKRQQQKGKKNPNKAEAVAYLDGPDVVTTQIQELYGIPLSGAHIPNPRELDFYNLPDTSDSSGPHIYPQYAGEFFNTTNERFGGIYYDLMGMWRGNEKQKPKEDVRAMFDHKLFSCSPSVSGLPLIIQYSMRDQESDAGKKIIQTVAELADAAGYDAQYHKSGSYKGGMSFILFLISLKQQ